MVVRESAERVTVVRVTVAGDQSGAGEHLAHSCREVEIGPVEMFGDLVHGVDESEHPDLRELLA